MLKGAVAGTSPTGPWTGGRTGAQTLERSVGLGRGEEGWDPKLCVPKMAQQDFPDCKFRFFPLWSLWCGEGEAVLGKGSPPPGF